MAAPSSLKTLNPIKPPSSSPYLTSMKPPSSSTTTTTTSSSLTSMKPPPFSSSYSLTSMKPKTLLQTFIFSHIYRLARALTKAKSVLIHLLKNTHFVHFVELPLRKNKNSKKLFFGSFRLHYNWCSSHAAMPVVLETYSNSHFYYDSGWNSAIPTMFSDDGMLESNELSRYLHWLEEKGDEDSSNEIDRLADLFIANCHEKFRLEKQESYRRFQEMMARSI